MELGAWIAGERHTSFPPDASDLLIFMVQLLNDAFDDEQRQRLIPYALPLAHSRASDAVERQRAAMAATWLEDEFPAFGDTAQGRDVAEAVALAVVESPDDPTDRILAQLGSDPQNAVEDWSGVAVDGEAELIESVLALLDRMLDVTPEDLRDARDPDDGDAGVLVLAS
jgi:hypothetical protein